MTKDRNADSGKNASLARLVSRGALWQFGGGTITSIIRLGASAVLARLLDPIDFGIMGMGILAMNALAYLGNIGVPAAIISKKNISNDDLYTGFCFLTLNRIILYILAFMAAPFIAEFFKEPKVTNLFRIVSVVLLLSVIEVIPQSLLVKQLKYKKIFFLNLVTAVFEAFLAITLVIFTNLKYWALAISMVGAYCVRVILINILVKWRPRFIFSSESFSFYKPYITNGLGASISLYLRQNIDYIIVGKLLGASSLGLYEYAYKIPHMFIDRFIFPTFSILFPALAKIQNDSNFSSNVFLRAVRLIVFIAFPPLLLLAATSHVVVYLLWGSKWLSIITPLKILCLAASLQSIAVINSYVFLIKKRPDLNFKNNLIQLSVTTFFVSLGGIFWGINGISLGILIGTFVNIFYLFYAFKLMHVNYKEACNLLIIALFSFLSSFLCYQIINMLNINLFFDLFLSLLFGIFLFLLLSFSFPASRAIFTDIFILIKNLF